MKYLLIITCTLFQLNGFGQEVQVKQLRSLLLDMKNNFQKTIGNKISSEEPLLMYNSRINLEGTLDNEVTLSKDLKTFNSYVAYISDSCSKKEAEKLADFWREVVQNAAPNYIESKLSGKDKDVQGNPRFGFTFTFADSEYSYSISITYLKRYIGKAFLVMMYLSRQQK